MKESDWKTFKIIKKRAVERFCTQALDEFQKVISNTDEHVHHRYGRLYGLVKDTDKDMAAIFDGLSRSKAWDQLFAIRARGLADEGLVAQLSEDLQQSTNPENLRFE